MEIEVFLGKIKAEFNEDYDMGDLGLDDNIKNMDWWSSMHALVIIALIDTEYPKLSPAAPSLAVNFCICVKLSLPSFLKI